MIPMNRYRHVGRLRDDKLLHFHRHGAGSKFLHHHRGDVRRHRLDQLPVTSLAEFQEALAHRMVIDGVGQIVRRDGMFEIVFNLDRQEQTLRPGPLVLRNADMVLDLQVHDPDLVHNYLFRALTASSNTRVGVFSFSRYASSIVTQRNSCASSLSRTSVLPAARQV